MNLLLNGKSCTLVLVHWPRNTNRRQNHHGGIKLLEGEIQIADGVVHLLPTSGAGPVLIPPHLVGGIEEFTDDIRVGLEMDIDTQLCLRAYFNGRSTLKALGWNAILT